MNRRTILTAGAALLAAPQLAASGSARAQGNAAASKTLRFIPQADLAVLDPIWTTAYVTRHHALLVFDTLYGQDSSFRPQPQMVEGHVVGDDGLRWTLRLRDGLQFHDGTPVLARDCVASIQRWGVRDSYGQRLMTATAELSAPDDRTILFRLRQPFPQLPEALGKATNNLCAMMPERLARTDPFRQVTEMVGSGPFRFLGDERVPGALAAYERFAGYTPRPEGQPSFTAGPKIARLDRVEWQVIPDPVAASGALRTGEIDWWELPTPDLLPQLRRDRALQVEAQDPTGYMGVLRVNHLHPPFNDPRVRRAVLSAVDQAEFMQAVVGDDRDAWRSGVGTFCPGTPMASTAGLDALRAPDLGRARAEVAAAGQAGATVVVLGATDLPILKTVADLTADLMGKLGFRVDYHAADWGTVVQRRASKEPPSRGGWNAISNFTGGLDQASPVTHTNLWANGAGAAPGWPDSPAIETLRTEWLAAPDLEAQRSVAERLQIQAMQDVPYVPLGQYLFVTAYRRTLQGIGKGLPVFWGLEKA